MKAVFRFTVKADKIGEFTRIAAELVTKSRTDAGCLAYDLFQDQNNAQCFAIIEEWESPKAFQGHSQSPHAIELGPLLDATLEKLPPEAYFYHQVC